MHATLLVDPTASAPAADLEGLNFGMNPDTDDVSPDGPEVVLADENFNNPEDGLPAPSDEALAEYDPVRAYVREMASVPLLSREGEVQLALRMHRGKQRMQKGISRSAVVQRAAVEVAGQLKKAIEEEGVLGGGDIEEAAAADEMRPAYWLRKLTELIDTASYSRSSGWRR